MSRLDDLPPDHRAALSLLLRQRKAYAEVAAMLQIGERAVHDRAHAALAVLAPREAREFEPERREEIGDYLLGQSGGVSQRLRARRLLDGSPAAQAWARAVAGELAPLAPGALPEIPDGGSPSVAGAPGAPAGGRVHAESPRPESSVTPTAQRESPGSRTAGSASLSAARTAAQLPSSRVGGAILLAAIAAVVVTVVLLTSGGSSHHRARSSAASPGAASAPSTTPRASETRRLTLTAPNPSSKAIGVAAVLQEGSTYAFYLAAERLPPSKGFFYAVWLYNSPSSFEALSKSPPVGSDGRLQGGALLPGNAGSYHQMIVTRETSERPTSPGTVVLRGSFGLH